MNKAEIQPHIRLQRSQTTEVVIVVGDPMRTRRLADLCDKSAELECNREYRSIKCTFKGETFLVVSHGVGAAGALICFEELIANGAKVIIRAGTAGSLQPQTIVPGDIVICHSAIREDGATDCLIPRGFPAVSDMYVLQTLQEVAKHRRRPVRTGMALSSSQYYRNKFMSDESSLDMYCKIKVDIVEMEVSALFIICRLKGVKAGALCVTDGCPLNWDNQENVLLDKECSDFEDGMNLLLEVAIEAAAKCSFEKRWLNQSTSS